MSSEQASITDYETDAAPTPEWTPRRNEIDVRRCQKCGAHVTPGFRRSMGDNNDTVYGCPECTIAGDLLLGAAADPDFTTRVDTNNNGGQPR